ncbi:MAG TPA: glycosyltransferase family 4 protein [Deltaproteobacteria bacterium]|nr:glycosyltransferase family 4 protein [Deltaproteobacteria bacterium]
MNKPDWLVRDAALEAPVETLEAFLEAIDSGALLNISDPSVYREIRKTTDEVLVQLLVWQRPRLEESRSLTWPYDALRKRKSIFENLYAKEAGRDFARQAALFLALLPFPGQWQWLFKAEQEFRDDPEIHDFLTAEREKIEEKISKKRQKEYNLYHFCQILKKSRLPREKGIIRIFALAYLFTQPRILRELSKRYLIYIEPAAGVFFRHTWWRFLTILDDPCLIGAACEEDRAYLNSQNGVLTTHLAHSDYIEDDETVDAGHRKRFDIVFNGTYDEMDRKRHLFMLSLLRHPLLQDKTALFMGRGKNENIERFKQQVHLNRMDERVTVLANIRRNEVPKYLAECRVGVHLALHENGPRCIYEFFRADIPCVISACTAGVNFEHFNSRTGVVAKDKDLAQAIAEALQSGHRFAPRKWFLEQSGSLNSTRILNRRFQEIFQSRGYDWTEDIVPLGSSGASRYVISDHYFHFRSEFEQLFEFLNQEGMFPVPVVFD